MKDNHFRTVNPSTNKNIPIDYPQASIEEVNQSVILARDAFVSYRGKSQIQRAAFLRQIIVCLNNLKEEIISICHLETALPLGRLEGEFLRTTGQISMFADLLENGSWVDAIIDTAQPDHKPTPRVDLRQMLIPLGPVAVFGASNFPLAFSVAGGDTISALASGCTVVVKSHPEHPGTSKFVANAITDALSLCDLPKAVFQLLQGDTHQLGAELVQHPEIKAVGFTGSFNGGKALFDLANQRPEPIPVFAEMGSVNPVLILPNTLASNGAEIAKGLAQSVSLGVGQFCTNPGLVFFVDSEGSDEFLTTLDKLVQEIPSATMLSPSISGNYKIGLTRLKSTPKLTSVTKGIESEDANCARTEFFITDFDTFCSIDYLSEEVFGPVSLLVSVSEEQINSIPSQLAGQLTASIFGDPQDLIRYNHSIESITHLVGRIIINGYPTGVEVTHAMVHGGPFPATTQVQSTSVGTQAIRRFTRPVCYQNFTQDLLPDELKDDNPLMISRKINGIIK